jgi:hypothetical protein
VLTFAPIRGAIKETAIERFSATRTSPEVDESGVKHEQTNPSYENPFAGKGSYSSEIAIHRPKDRPSTQEQEKK